MTDAITQPQSQQNELILNAEVLRKLRQHAARRDLPVPALALLIVEAVADDGMVDAVLDDRETPRRRIRGRPGAVPVEPLREAPQDPRVTELLRAAGPAVRKALLAAADRHGITPTDIVSHRRSSAAARQEAWWVIAASTTLSLPEIGRRTGGFDHSTVLHGIRRHAEIHGPARRSAPAPVNPETSDAR